MSKFIIGFLLVFFSASINYAQKEQFEFDFQQIAGELTNEDLFKETIGRYDGFEIPLYKGEVVNFLLYSEEFNPVLILAAPDGNTFRQSIGEKYNFAKISVKIPAEGDYYLYVVGGRNGLGRYYLQNAIGPETAFQLPHKSGFCDKLFYILSHARASFQMLGGDGKSEVSLDGSQRNYLNSDDGSYHTVFYEGKNSEEAEKIYSSLIKQIDDCLDDNWKFNSVVPIEEGNYLIQDKIFVGKDSLQNNLQIILRTKKLIKINLDPIRPVTFEIIFKIVS